MISYSENTDNYYVAILLILVTPNFYLDLINLLRISNPKIRILKSILDNNLQYFMFRRNTYKVNVFFLNSYIWKSTYLTSLWKYKKIQKQDMRNDSLTASKLWT